MWLDPATRCDDRAPGVDPPGAGVARGVCAADGAHVDLAAGRRARYGRARHVGQSPGAAPVRRRDHRAGRQRSACDSHRRPARGGAPRGVGALVRTRRPRPRPQRGVARAGVGALRGRVRGRGGVRGVGARGLARRRAARARCGLAPLGVHRRHRRRDRVLARHLARGIPAPGLAGGLRRLTVAGRRCAGARATGRRHPFRGRVLRLPRHRTARARRRGPASGAGLGGRHRGREWRGQDDARQAPVSTVSTDTRAHPRRRGGARAHARGRLAVPAFGGVSGLLPVRVQATRDGGCGRSAPPRRRVGRDGGHRPGRRERRRPAARRGSRNPARAHLA